MSVLIVKIGGIGDVLMARGMALQAVKSGHRVTWLCGSQMAGLVRKFEGVDEVLEIDEKALYGLKGRLARVGMLAGNAARLALRRFDLVVTAHSDPRYRLLSASVIAKERRAFGRGHFGPIPGRFHGDEYIRLIHAGDSALAPKADLPLLRSWSPTHSRKALLFPGGAKNALRDDTLRRWPLEHYAALAAKLIQEGWQVALGGAPSDTWTRAAFHTLSLEDHIGQGGLEETLDFCASASVVITHDSGPLHLAVAAGVPVVALFGPTLPGEKIQPDRRVKILWGGEALACRPCYDGKNYAPCSDNVCLNSVGVDQVIAAVRELHAL